MFTGINANNHNSHRAVVFHFDISPILFPESSGDYI